MEVESILKVAGVITALIATLFALRKFYKWLRPIHIEPSYTISFDNSDPNEIYAKIINRSTEPQYILRCSAKGTYSLRYILMTHIRNPLIRPSLYPNISYGGVVYDLMKGEANELPRSRAARYQKEFSFNPDAKHRGILLIKLELHQPVKLSCKIFDHPLNAMFTPYFFIEVELSSGRTVHSKKLQAPERWKHIGRDLLENKPA